MEYKRHPENNFNHLLSIFFIYPMIVPLIILDFFLEVYHNIGFRLYNLPLVERAKYVRIDRHKLSYLGLLAKINCVYCGYANGLLAYAARIAGDTEAYWCGIKHAPGNGFIEPAHQKHFIKYGDEFAYYQVGKEKICKLSKEKI